MITRLTQLILSAPLLLLLASCSENTDFDFAPGIASQDATLEAINAANVAASGPQALFSPDPAAPILPFPNNLFFSGSIDGTLNIPVATDADQTLANPQVALNQLDGFSTVAPISTTVSEPLDPASLVIGDTIRVYEVTAVQGLGVAVLGTELTAAQITAITSGDQLVLIPLVPLKEKQDYLIVLTSGITDVATDTVDAMPLQASLLYSALKEDEEFNNPTLDALRVATNSHVAQLAAAGIAAEDIALTWVFRTQSVRDVLQATQDISTPATSSLTLIDSGQDVPGTTGADASIYVGSIDIPYYLTAVGADNNPVPALNSFWRSTDGADFVPGAINAAVSANPNYTPAVASVEKIPVIMTLPDSAAPDSMPWPVTIFQHGITSNRTAMLAIARSMAAAGRAVIAIDMPLHGLISSDGLTGPFMVMGDGQTSPRERTFGIDLTTNPGQTPLEGSNVDGIPDPSGTYFINLTNLANTRDNLRQAIVDLFVLRESLVGATISDGSVAVSFDDSDVSFVGHSLGGIVGTTMLSYYDNTRFTSATLGMPGGGIAQLLANSGAFGPQINEGLAGEGIATGSAEYNQFLLAAQTMADSGDPINHAGFLAEAADAPALHMIEVLGDTVVPNAVATAPLSGTEPLARQLQLPQVDATSSSGGIVCFTQSNHSSLLIPLDISNPVDTAEMQTQSVGFAASQGANLPIDNSSGIIQAVVVDPTSSQQVPCSIVAAGSN